MKLKLNDQVQVISGKDKGKKGHIIKLDRKNNKVAVEKLNMRTKHVRKSKEKAGEIIHFEAYMNVSNVAIVCPACGKLTRVAYKILTSGEKQRVCKKCKESLEKEKKVKTK